jgi:hypothetical protein
VGQPGLGKYGYKGKLDILSDLGYQGKLFLLYGKPDEGDSHCLLKYIDYFQDIIYAPTNVHGVPCVCITPGTSDRRARPSLTVSHL